MKRLLILLPILLCSCSTTRQVQMQVAEHIRKDTVCLCNVQYDSIYIYKDKFTDRNRDTLYIQELQTEYRYKLLRDTVRIVQRDSIPYEVRIIETKEVKYAPSWIKALAYIGIISILYMLFYLIRITRKLNLLIP